MMQERINDGFSAADDAPVAHAGEARGIDKFALRDGGGSSVHAAASLATPTVFLAGVQCPLFADRGRLLLSGGGE